VGIESDLFASCVTGCPTVGLRDVPPILAWRFPLSDALPSSPTTTVQGAHDFDWDGDKLEAGIALALSGGGFRAMLFHAGALMRLNELGLLSQISRISSVSGGSIAAGFLARVWNGLAPANGAGTFDQFQQKYVEPILAFSRENIDVGDVLAGLLPWTSAAEKVAASYDKALLNKITLQDIPDHPRFVFCATNLQTGVLWRFSKPYAGDYVIGRLDTPRIPLSTAVAASSAFPPFFSPLRLTLPQGSITDWPGQAAAGPRAIDPAPYRTHILLTDGGVYDNHGLEPIEKRYMTLLVSDGGAPFARNPSVATDPVRQLQRVLEVEDNQVRALRRRDLIARYKKAVKNNLQPNAIDDYARFGTYWGIDTDPTKVAPANALACPLPVVDQLAHVSTRLSDPGETAAKQLVNWGYAISDRCLRGHYKFVGVDKVPAPQWPYPAAKLG
jgi:NTE family protein